MTKKKDSRWSYMKSYEDGIQGEETATPASPALPAINEKRPSLSAVDPDTLRSVPRRGGRGEQKTQLNIRIPKELKRLATAQAALEGRTIGDLVEELLIRHLSIASNKAE